MYEVQQEIRREQLVASTLLLVTPDEIGSSLERALPSIWNYLQDLEIPPAGAPFTRYHDVQEDQVRIEVGMPVPEAFPGDDSVESRLLPGGLTANTWHIGPYDRLKEAYQAIEAWMQDNGYEPGGAPWEVYHTDPGEEPDPANWRTEVVWPIKPVEQQTPPAG